MKLLRILFVLCCVSAVIYSETAEQIIEKIDYNQTPDSIVSDGEMIIHKRGKVFRKKLRSYSKGKDTAFTEFLSPARDKGTRYLRRDNNLWMFLPRASRTIKISGHMLRQSMMGSDFSYDDQTERLKLAETYDMKLLDDEQYEGKKVYVLELVAKKDIETSYYKRKIWVDKEKYVVLRSDMYARSGKLLKTLSVLETKTIDGREYAVKIKMEDKIKGNSYTEVVITDIKLDVDIPERTFSFQNLERRK